ncbi:MAG: hypothetical protein ACI81L_000576 [Verrucomicrobiales bacterium]|jgi:hypothetical protein
MADNPTQSHTTVGTFSVVSHDDIVAASNDVFNRPDIEVEEIEDVFTIEVAGMDWDIGAVRYQPKNDASIAVGADGRRVGIHLLHGGAGDFKTMHERAHLLASKFGFCVVTGTFPGRFNFDDPNRDWPGDTIHSDGSVRTPLWQRGEHVTPDQYDVIEDDTMRARYGRRTVARARPGSRFQDRLGASPIAMESACRTTMERHFPTDEFSIYVHGHSTGGPLQFMMSQRVPNIVGVLAAEHSAFGYINQAKHRWGGSPMRTDVFDELYVRTWRDLARYMGIEALGTQGAEALRRLPWLMEDVLDAWDEERIRPQFKCEYPVTWNIVDALEAAARHTATRLNFDEAQTLELVQTYLGLAYELRGPSAKPVPNVLFGISTNSRDHRPEVYEEVILPMFAEMQPAPRVTVTRYEAGMHDYSTPEQDLPMGIAPAIFTSWNDAIMNGYFVDTEPEAT